jgi:hypothetical protein
MFRLIGVRHTDVGIAVTTWLPQHHRESRGRVRSKDPSAMPADLKSMAPLTEVSDLEDNLAVTCRSR